MRLGFLMARLPLIEILIASGRSIYVGNNGPHNKERVSSLQFHKPFKKRTAAIIQAVDEDCAMFEDKANKKLSEDVSKKVAKVNDLKMIKSILKLMIYA